MAPSDREILARAEVAARIVGPLAARSEALGRLAPECVEALQQSGAFKLLVPRAYGGAECSVADYVSALERVARADGAAGWCAMIGATSGMVAAWLPDELSREVFTAPDATTCGVFAPTGRASITDEGLHIRGRWSFASGCEHASWRMVGVVMCDGDVPRTLAHGGPDARCVLLRADETRVTPNWNVLGLRGTGSHDLVVEGVTVPASRCFSLFEPARHGGALYRAAVFGVLAAGVAAVALGIAAAAVDRFVALAREKVPMGARRSLAHRELAQHAVATAEARVRAARLLVLDAAERVNAGDDDASPVERRASLRLAACHASREATAAVELLYNAAGAGAIRDAEPLQRMFRDVHVASQHAMVADAVTVLTGRVRLGLDTDLASL